MSSERFELVFRGPQAAASPEEIRELKRTLVTEFQFSVDQVRDFFEQAPLSIVQSTSEGELELYCRTLLLSGADVAIVRAPEDASASSDLDDIEQYNSSVAPTSSSPTDIHEVAENDDKQFELTLAPEPAGETQLLESALKKVEEAPDWSLEIPTAVKSDEKPSYGLVLEPAADTELSLDESPRQSPSQPQQPVSHSPMPQEDLGLELESEEAHAEAVTPSVAVVDESPSSPVKPKLEWPVADTERTVARPSPDEAQLTSKGQEVSGATQNSKAEPAAPPATEQNEKEVAVAGHGEANKEQDGDVVTAESDDVASLLLIDGEKTEIPTEIAANRLSPRAAVLIFGFLGLAGLYYYHFQHTRPTPVVLQTLPLQTPSGASGSVAGQDEVVPERREYEVLNAGGDLWEGDWRLEFIGERPVRFQSILRFEQPAPLTPRQIVRKEPHPIWVERMEVQQGVEWERLGSSWVAVPRVVAFLTQGERRSRAALRGEIHAELAGERAIATLRVRSSDMLEMPSEPGFLVLGKTLEHPAIEAFLTFDSTEFRVIDLDIDTIE